MGKYLDKTGLQYFYGKLKEKFADKTTIENKLDSLTGALTWKGKFDTLPAVTNYKAGNVVGVGNKEYVLTVTGSTKAWEELGDEGSYLLKSVAEETYLKKADGAVATANIADGAVISTKLATGARKPIILTPDTTEVDEETYQKLLSNDVDVVFKAPNEIIYPLYSKEQNAHSKHLILIFAFPVCLTGPNTEITDDVNYTVRILPTGNHSVIITENKATKLSHYLSANGYVTGDVVYKKKLSLVLKEIDLTGTDADRKAKLDKFAADWKSLTGASDLSGARFVGKFVITEDVERNVTGIMTYCAGDGVNDTTDNCFYGICNGYSFGEQKSQIAVKVSCTDGSLTITPLFSHLEAITIRIDNTPESKAANVAAIEAYEYNLEALGFDMTKGYMIPITASGRNGFLSTRSGNYPYAGYVAADSSVSDFYNILILGNGEYYDSKIQSENSSELNTISKKLVPAINEVNTLAKNKQDKLTSGTNIKTINNQSLLGSGNIEISAPSITVDASMSNTSTNPVQNKVIKAYIDGLVENVTAWIEYE